MRMLKLVLAFKNLGLEFSLKVRIRRKYRHIEIIKNFFRKVKNEAGPQIVKSFMHNVRKAQTYVRCFLACRAARRELCSRFWVKIESKIRSDLVAAQHARHIESQNTLSNVPEIMETIFKFRASKSKAIRMVSSLRRLEHERHEKNSGKGERGAKRKQNHHTTFLHN